MLIEERRRRLLEAVRTRGALSVAEAEKTLAVSRMTIHRDFDVLAEQGLVRKVHGGVVAVKEHGADLFDPRAQPFEERLAERREAKQAIARALAELTRDASTLLLDASTTVYFLSEHLREVPAAGERHVVTGSLPLFTALVRQAPHLRVSLTGGEPHVRTGSLVGPLAIASLGDSRFDFAVMSCLSVMEDEGSVFVASAEEASVKRAYLEHARKTVLACDSSKFGRTGVYPLGALQVFDYVVTEAATYGRDELRAALARGALGRVRGAGA